MTKSNQIQIFNDRKVRTVWDSETEEWYFSVVDVVEVLTDARDYQVARKYWNKLKERLRKEGNETVTNCHQLKLPAADGKMRLTDVATPKQMFRIIQSIPSPKAEPFKQWMAQVAATRLDQTEVSKTHEHEDLATALTVSSVAKSFHISRFRRGYGRESTL